MLALTLRCDEVERMWDRYDTDPAYLAEQFAYALHEYWKLGKWSIGFHCRYGGLCSFEENSGLGLFCLLYEKVTRTVRMGSCSLYLWKTVLSQ